jgi:hypothetical protein
MAPKLSKEWTEKLLLLASWRSTEAAGGETGGELETKTRANGPGWVSSARGVVASFHDGVMMGVPLVVVIVGTPLEWISMGSVVAFWTPVSTAWKGDGGMAMVPDVDGSRPSSLDLGSLKRLASFCRDRENMVDRARRARRGLAERRLRRLAERLRFGRRFAVCDHRLGSNVRLAQTPNHQCSRAVPRPSGRSKEPSEARFGWTAMTKVSLNYRPRAIIGGAVNVKAVVGRVGSNSPRVSVQKSWVGKLCEAEARKHERSGTARWRRRKRKIRSVESSRRGAEVVERSAAPRTG